MKLARPKIVFTGLPEGYQTSFWAEDFGIFMISSIATKKDEPKCPLLPILAGSLVCVSLTTMSSTESSICRSPEPMDLSGCFSTPSPNTSLSSSSSSSGVRSLSRKRRASNYLMGTARAPFKSRTLEKSLIPLLVLPGERKSIPSPLTALFSKFRLCRRHFL